jgi:sulfoxide reductase heme-binding subunit YedZ
MARVPAGVGLSLDRDVWKPLVFSVSFSPLVFILRNALIDVSPNFNAVVRDTGFWSLRFLCLTLAITPIRWLTGWHTLVKFRRMLGLFGFFYAVVHTAAYVAFDRVAGLDPAVRVMPWAATLNTVSAIGMDLLRPFFAIGFLALVLMVPLAATSTGSMIRRLGGSRWQALHRLAYPAAIGSVLHTYWPLDRRWPTYALIVCVIFALRASRAYARRQQVSTVRTAAVG